MPTPSKTTLEVLVIKPTLTKKQSLKRSKTQKKGSNFLMNQKSLQSTRVD